MKQLLGSLCIILFTGLSLAAQGLKDTLHLKEVELIADKKHSGVKVVELDSALQNSPSSTLAEILSRKSSVFIKTYGPGTLASPSFRGTNARQTKVFWNGLPVNSPMYGESDLNLFPVFVLSGASLKMGGAGIEDGAGSFGGSIELSSHEKNEYNYALINQSIGSFNTYVTGIGARYGSRKLWGDTKLYNGIADNNFPYEDISRPGKPITRQQNAAYAYRGLMQQAGSWLNDNTIVESTLWLQKMERELPTILFTKPQGETQDDASIRFNLRGMKYYKTGNFEANLNWSDEKQRYENPNSGVYADNNFRRFQAKLNYRKNFKKIETAAGVQSLLDMAFTNNYNGNRQRLVLSLPLKISYSPVKRLSLILNSRPEAVDFKLIPLIFNLSANWQAVSKDRLDLYVSGGKNYNYPTLNDLYWQPGGNPNLLPEEGFMLESGVRGKLTHKQGFEMEYSETFFSNVIDNQVQWLPGNTTYWTPQNLGKVWSRGAETELSFTYRKNNKKIMLSTAYAYVRSTDLLAIDEYKTRQLIYIPIHNITSNLEAAWKSYSFTLNNTYTGERTIFGGTLQGYQLLNTSIGKNFKSKHFNTQIRFRCDNLLDKEYQIIPWRPMPGRSFRIELNLKIK